MSHLPLGHRVDPSTLAPRGEPYHLPASALTRHAVCVGMTGSGKTGLCVGLLEEVALAGVPVLAVDPKGDLANLALVFPDLSPARFRPWVDPARAAREETTPEALAHRTAASWRQGLAAEGLTEAHLADYHRRVDVQILTPGSTAGTPIDVLAALTRAPAGLARDPEGLREYVTGAVGALLGLLGREPSLVDPATLLLTRLLSDAFAAGRDLPLEALVRAVVDPPFDRLGVLPVDEVLPDRARSSLAVALNAVLASPTFAPWRAGVPLDVDTLLAAPDGRTPVRVLYLAHLDDAQRMFFASLLLNAVVAWSRRQPGSASLRALLYFDEVFGFLPPHPRDPPSKRPVLTLMKQARAVGLGVVLATQNPVDVDYKALSNAGTWLVGRLQTRQDRERVLDGLTAAAGGPDPALLDRLVARLPGRTFLVRELSGRARLLRSRHVRAYLRGPLTRREVASLTAASRRAPPAAPRGLRVRWLDPDAAPSYPLQAPPSPRAWRPAVYARLQVRFQRGDGSEARVVHRLGFPLLRPDAPLRPVALDDDHLLHAAPADGAYAPLPRWLDTPDEVQRLARRLVDEAVRDERGAVLHDTGSGHVSAPGEDLDAFVARLRAAGVTPRAVLETPVPAQDARVLGLALVWVPAG